MNVVSFYAPRPEHPFAQDYTPFLNLLRASCERFGHRHVVLTDDASVGDDVFVADLPRPLMPAFVAAQLAYIEAHPDTPTLFTGADCVLANDPAAFEQFDADIAITVGPFADCRMNTGAIYMRRPGRLEHVWRDAVARCGDEWGDDQRAILAAIEASGVSVYELPVDPYNLAPEHPGDDCTRAVVVHFRGPRKAWMVDYCHKWFGLGEGIVVHALPNTDAALAMENVRINARRDLPWVVPVEAHERHAVIVGGGPSLAETLPEIRRRVLAGQDVFALNGTIQYLITQNVWPNYGVILDPRPENARFVTDRGMVYLLASQCAPEVFAELDGHEARVWHFAEKGISEAIPYCHPPPTLIGGGITVGLTAMALCHAMGYRHLHLYGYDSSDRDDASHAYAQGENAAERKRLEVWCNGTRFLAGIAMYAQANAFPEFSQMLIDAGSVITVHGDGLLPTLARAMQNAQSVEQGEAA